MHRFVSAVIVFLTLSQVSWTVDWYSSAANGVPGAPIPGSRPKEEGWSVSIDYKDDEEVRRLYKDGVVQSMTAFYRSDGRLMAREEKDADGNLISRVEYAYDESGNPRAIFIGTSHVETDIRVNADKSVWRHGSGAGDEWRITELDDSGRPVSRVSLDSGSIAETLEWKRDDDGDLREEIRRVGDDVHRSLYDSSGRLIEETTTRSGTIVLLRAYTWSGNDLKKVEERGEGRIVVREMDWRGGRMIRETRTVDGVLSNETVWENEDDRVETLFRDGQPVIRVYWSDQVRIREEFLKEGEVVRVRESGT
jgi:hypothetical protein